MLAEALWFELKRLLLKQTETIEAQTFGGLTDAERFEYEQRAGRIRDLCGKLSTRQDLAA